MFYLFIYVVFERTKKMRVVKVCTQYCMMAAEAKMIHGYGLVESSMCCESFAKLKLKFDLGDKTNSR